MSLFLERERFLAKVELQRAQEAVERAIDRIPTSEFRNEVTEVSMKLMELIERAPK